MQLTEAQIRFFGTFGYLGFPGLLSAGEAAWITEEFETAIRSVGGGERHNGTKRTMFGGPIERTTKLCTAQMSAAMSVLLILFAGVIRLRRRKRSSNLTGKVTPLIARTFSCARTSTAKRKPCLKRARSSS